MSDGNGLTVGRRQKINFGSYARGDWDDKSDIDIFITLDMSLEQTSALNNDMAQIDSDSSLEHDITVSTIVQPAEHFRKYADSHLLFINVLREGIKYGEKQSLSTILA